MQRSTHAAQGAWTLGTPAPSWGDAFRSLTLVGDDTWAAAGPVPTTSKLDFDEPIAAARAWLTDPGRRAALPRTVLERAEESLDVARAHLRELDLLAGDVAREVNDGRHVEPARLEQLEVMASTMHTFSDRLRSLLDPETVQVDDAERRLDSGLAAAAHGGGLPALLAAL